MGDDLKILNFQEWKGLYVLFFKMYIVFPVLIIITVMIVQVKFSSGLGYVAVVKLKADFFKSRHSESRPMVSFSPLRSWSLNNHNRQAEAFPLLWDLGLTGNYSSACLLTMEIDFIQITKSTQTHACMPSVSVLVSSASASLLRPPGYLEQPAVSPSGRRAPMLYTRVLKGSSEF